VADVPDKPVAGELEDAVQGDGQLHDAERSPEVPAVDRHGVDDPFPDLPGQSL
jgi:hypothetical protein